MTALTGAAPCLLSGFPSSANLTSLFNLNLLSFDPSLDPRLPAAQSTRFNLRETTK